MTPQIIVGPVDLSPHFIQLIRGNFCWELIFESVPAPVFEMFEERSAYIYRPVYVSIASYLFFDKILTGREQTIGHLIKGQESRSWRLNFAITERGNFSLYFHLFRDEIPR